MNLEDFVAGTLAQIVRGVQRAQADAAETGAWINPVGTSINTKHDAPALEVADRTFAYMHDVQFDVAVTVSNEQSADAGAGIQVFGAKIGAGGEVTYQNVAVSRVQFVVPVVWPGARREELEKVRKERSQVATRKVRSAGVGGWTGR